MRVSVTDNWTLQDAVSLLSGRGEPSREVSQLVFEEGRLAVETVPNARVQLESLANLLSLIVLSDEIRLIGDWVDTWAGVVPELDQILGSHIRPTKGRQDPQVSGLRDHYQAILDQQLEATLTRDIRRPLRNAVLLGTSVYVALAELAEATYHPHPQRARLLSATLYTSDGEGPHTRRFLRLVDESRLRVTRTVLGEAVVDTALISMPSIPLYCLREASDATSPVAVALQLRTDPGVRRFRGHMANLQALLERGKEERYVQAVAAFPDLIAQVEKSLGVKALDATDGPEKLSVVRGLSVPVPDYMRRVRFPTKHSGFISKLVLAGVEDSRTIVSRALGLRDAALLRQLVNR